MRFALSLEGEGFMNFLVGVSYILIAVILSASKIIARGSTLIPNTEFFTPYWAGAAYDYGDNSDSYYCSISTQYSNGDIFLVSINSDYTTLALNINSPTLRGYKINDTIPVSLQVDTKQVNYTSMKIVANNFGTILINEGFQKNISQLQKGKSLYVTSRNWRINLPLVGSYNGLEAAKQCILRNSKPTVDTQPALQPVSDKTLAYQIATTTITQNGLSDFKFLTAQERTKRGWPEGVAWTAADNQITGLVAVATGHDEQLSASDANDIHWLASFCSGDYLTSVRDIKDVEEFKTRELVLLCNSNTGRNHTAYLTKSLLFDYIVYQVVTVLEGKQNQDWKNEDFRNDLALASAEVLATFKN